MTAVLVGLVLAPSCQKKQSARSKTSPSAERQATLAAVAECVASTYRDADKAFRALHEAVLASKSEPSAEKRELARGAWSSAMEIWQQAEVMQLGPAASPAIAGGKDLRNQIYSWPLTSRCMVDQQLVSQGYASPDFPASSLVNVRGLDAAEYLLFHEGTDNGCAENASINTGGSWAALSSAELATRKAAYSVVVTSDIVARSSSLLEAWDPAKGNFGAELASAGAGSKTFASDVEALNAVSDAMFYVEREVKDMKLARPLGLLECATATCPEALESRFAHRSKQHIRNNLVGFGKLLRGCGPNGEGKGIDDLLVVLQAGDLAKRMSDALTNALVTLDAIEEDDLGQALANDYASVKALHEAVKALTDLLKTEFVTVLTLELPPLVQGDND